LDLQLAATVYPDVKFRVIGPSKKLPSSLTPLDFNPRHISNMMKLGHYDAVDVVKSEAMLSGPKKFSDLIQNQEFQKYHGFNKLRIPSFTDDVKPILPTQTCHALVIGGGGDKGSYEAGVISGLADYLDPVKSQWHIVTGTSAGALNTFGLSMFSIGEEKAAAAYLKDKWSTLSADHVYELWPIQKGGLFKRPRALFQGLVKHSGVYNTDPEEATLKVIIDEKRILNSDRALYVGATDLSTGLYTVF
jgi:predicted acylesterase/phospholipase RssA